MKIGDILFGILCFLVLGFCIYVAYLDFIKQRDVKIQCDEISAKTVRSSDGYICVYDVRRNND